MPPPSVPPSLPPPLSVRSNDRHSHHESAFSIPATLAMPPGTPLSQPPATPSTVGGGLESHAQPVLQ